MSACFNTAILFRLCYVETRQRYGNFSIFQDGGRRHVGFLKFQIFNSRTAQEGLNASSCQIWSKSVKLLPRYRDFSIFQDSGCRHLGFFLNFKLLTVGQVKTAELRRRAKFGRNWSNPGRDTESFRFFKMAAATILDV